MRQNLAFFEITIGNILLGNSDNHAKNHTLLYTSQRPLLAPTYDIHPVLLENVTHEMSFRIGAVRMADDETSADLNQFLQSIGARGFSRPQMRRCSEMVEAALSAATEMPRPAGKRLVDVIRQQAHHLSKNAELGIDVPAFDAVTVNRV